MANLNRLLELNGAVSAGEFTPSGELVSYEGNLPLNLARQVAKMCAANTMMGISQAESFTQTSGMKWSPHASVCAGGLRKLAICSAYKVSISLAAYSFTDDADCRTARIAKRPSMTASWFSYLPPGPEAAAASASWTRTSTRGGTSGLNYRQADPRHG